MIARSSTLRSSRQIQYILKKGERRRSQYFYMTTLLTRTNETSKFITLVSKKVSKKAHIRNFIRRRITHLYLLQNLDIPKHIIISPQRDISQIPFQSLQKDFQKLIWS